MAPILKRRGTTSPLTKVLITWTVVPRRTEKCKLRCLCAIVLKLLDPIAFSPLTGALHSTLSSSLSPNTASTTRKNHRRATFFAAFPKRLAFVTNHHHGTITINVLQPEESSCWRTVSAERVKKEEEKKKKTRNRRGSNVHSCTPPIALGLSCPAVSNWPTRSFADGITISSCPTLIPGQSS